MADLSKELGDGFYLTFSLGEKQRKIVVNIIILYLCQFQRYQRLYSRFLPSICKIRGTAEVFFALTAIMTTLSDGKHGQKLKVVKFLHNISLLMKYRMRKLESHFTKFNLIKINWQTFSLFDLKNNRSSVSRTPARRVLYHFMYIANVYLLLLLISSKKFTKKNHFYCIGAPLNIYFTIFFVL